MQTGPFGWLRRALRRRRSRSNSPSDPPNRRHRCLLGECMRRGARAPASVGTGGTESRLAGGSFEAGSRPRSAAIVVGHRRAVLRADRDQPQDPLRAGELSGERAPTDINGRHKTAPDRPRSPFPPVGRRRPVPGRVGGRWCIRAVAVGDRMSVEAVGQRNVVSTAGRPVWTAAVLLVIPAIMVNIVERALCGAD